MLTIDTRAESTPDHRGVPVQALAVHHHLPAARADALAPGEPAAPVALEVAPRRAISDADRARYERYLAEILGSLGMDLHRPGTERTPERFLQALVDATDGYDGDPKLLTAFPTECHGGANCELAQVVEGPIPFTALCEHHALPFVGRAWVGYVAHEQ